MKDLLDRRLAHIFVGRTEEIGLLMQTLDADGPLVMHLHGIAGSGKSTVLEVFAQRACAAGAAVIRLDCGGVEPTQAGFLSEVASGGEVEPGTAEEIATRLGKTTPTVILTLDNYEVFRLMDTWLRQIFVPLLPQNVRLILCGREAPVTAWMSAPGWHGLFQSVRLDCLDARNALEYLSRVGVPPEEAKCLDGFCRGLPLALTLAASLRNSERTLTLSTGIGHRIIAELSNLYVSDITDPQTRRALEAAAVVRRVTLPLLAVMLPDASPHETLARIGALPFVQADRDGLHIHPAVRDAIALTLRAQNPHEYHSYRRAAYHYFMSGLRSTARPDLWRYIADWLYLIENPVVREAFFPSGAQDYAVEPAQPQDHSAVLQIVARHEGPVMCEAMTQWWNRAPESFVVVRDRRGEVAGFYCAFEHSRDPCMQAGDPIVNDWLQHLDQSPMPRQHRALLLRRWLAADTGEAPSDVQAACWVDLKRKYLELRPNLRRVYLTLQDLSPYAAVARKLGFQVLAGRDVRADNVTYSTAMLDFGPESVDGWLARLVAAELGIDEEGLLDNAARELVVNGRRVPLTRLEFGVMEYLQQHAGKAVSRVDLLQNVWEQTYDGGSNVVDVVIRALRKKLGNRASMIQTVQGVGYRLRRG